MRIKILYLFVIFGFFSLYKTQEIRIQYQLGGLPISDSLNTVFNLDINTEKSNFYLKELCSSENPASQLVIKKYQSGIKLFDNINGVKVTVDLESQFDWKILDETKEENDFKLQKAIAKYKDKNIIAWFSTDLDLLDGPFIFKGLPGLITSLEIVESKINFKLISISYIGTSLCEKMNYKDSKNLNKKKYFEFIKNEDQLNNSLFKSFEKLNFPQDGLKSLESKNKDKRVLNTLKELI